MKFIKTLLFCFICIFSNAQNWFPVSDGINSGVVELFSFEGKLFITGSFGTIDGIPATGIAYWDEKKWRTFSVDGLPYFYYRALGTYNNELYSFAIGSNVIGEIVKYDKLANTWISMENSEVLELAPNPQLGRVFHSIEFQDEFYISGIFDRIGDKEIKNIAKWDGTEWNPVLDGFGNELDISNITALGVYNNELIICGKIGPINNESYHGIARWNGERWSNLGDTIRANVFGSGSPSIYNLEVFQGKLYVGGYGIQLPEDDKIYPLAQWDGNSWYGFEDFEYESIRINALKSFGNYLAIGGDTPKGLTYLYNGKSVKKIEQEFTSRIIDFAEMNNQLYVSTPINLDTFIASESGILKLGLIEPNPDSNPKCSFFPNPTDGEFMIGYEVKENSTTIISFYNASGILLQEEIFNDLKGVYLRRFNLDDLIAGTYIAHIQSKEINESKIFIKN